MNLLGESHQLVRSCKCVPGYRAELGNKVRHIGVGSTAAHGRLINLLLGCGRRLGAAGHEPQPGVDAGELVGGVYQPADGLHTQEGACEVADRTKQGCPPAVGLRHLPRKFLHLYSCGRSGGFHIHRGSPHIVQHVCHPLRYL